MPLFIKNGGKAGSDYKDQWYQFLKRNRDSAFLISPRPKFTTDVILHGDKLKKLFEENIIPATTEFELGSNALYTLGSKAIYNLSSIMCIESVLEIDLKADAFYTALLYAYNQNPNKETPLSVIIGDIPTIIQREQAGRHLKVTQMQEMFKRTLNLWE